MANYWLALILYLALETMLFAFKEHGLEKYLNETTLADKGYVGLGLLRPIRRKPGVKVPQGVKDNNRIINRLQAVVEQVIEQLKA